MTLFTPNRIILFKDQDSGIVSTPITSTQSGRIKYQAVSWRASLYKTRTQISLQPGQTVKVIGRQGLTLLVQPDLKESQPCLATRHHHIR